ncbi:MAG: hypothetical protein ACI9BN_001377, partial [Francisella sp.]
FDDEPCIAASENIIYPPFFIWVGKLFYLHQYHHK